MIPKGTLLVMSTNSGYEDTAYPMHSVGPITGEVPRSYPVPPLPTSSSTASSSFPRLPGDKEKGTSLPGADAEANAEETEEGEKGQGKKTGTWAAGTGRMFDPSRWIKDGAFDPNAGPSIPFSLGQRGCFGKSLAVSGILLPPSLLLPGLILSSPPIPLLVTSIPSILFLLPTLVSLSISLFPSRLIPKPPVPRGVIHCSGTIADTPTVDGTPHVLPRTQSSLLLRPCQYTAEQIPEERDSDVASCLFFRQASRLGFE